MLKIIEKTKIWFAASLIVILVGMGFLAVKGLNFGIDFAGGTILEAKLNQQVNSEDVRSIVGKYVNDASVQTVENTGIMIRSSSITKDQIAQVKKDINGKYGTNDSVWSEENVGPSIGKELTRNAIIALLVATLAMLVYVAFRFEIRFGVAAILALVHDVLVMITVYAVLQIPVNSAFIAAILTVVGYSINDTIVIFDRIRENMRFMRKVDNVELANVSITQSMARSVNTVLTTLFTITVLYFVGVSSVKELALPLIIGIISGCYSSIFIASPIWVMLKSSSKGKRELAKA
jgi:preprotein translocase subunit SecF